MRLAMGASRRGHWLHLAVALALFAVVTGLRFIAPPNGYDGLTLLYILPVSLLALSRGIRGGFLAGCLGLALFVTWAEVEGVHVGLVGWLTRAVALLTFGSLIGRLADEQAQLELSNTRWFEMSNDLLVEADLRGYFTRVNDRWVEEFGWTPDELMARPMLDFVHPDDREATAAEGGRLDRAPGEIVNFENRYRAKDGTYRWLLWNARSDRHRKYAVARDITERKALEQEHHRLLGHMEELSRTDSLTGLPNRRAWEEAGTQAIARARRHGHPLALAMVDLDHFKRFNDAHGHQAGDALLAQIAAAWRPVVRATDFLARYGGEEFALLLPDCPPDEAVHLLDRLRAATPQGETCSIGIAHWDGVEDIDELLARADAALYEAKRVGRDRVVSAA